mmetsp:Transcript_65751/g.203843  ORF Transcript_65751/g.203843 Transcript_65751/m.203843 type:complete len:352 (+) Transcript_65751:354-1409(+)
MLASPSVVAAPTIGVQRARELGLGHQHDVVPDILSLHLGHKTLQCLVDLPEIAVEAILHHAVHVPAAGRHEEEVALRATALPRTDELGHLLQLAFQAAVGVVVGHRAGAGQDPLHVLCRLDVVPEGRRVRLRVHVAVLLSGDVVHVLPPLLVIKEGLAALRADNLPPHLHALGPDDVAGQGKGRRLICFRPQGEPVRNAAACTPGVGAELLALQRLSPVLLAGVREEVHAPRLRVPVGLCDRLHQVPDAGEEGRLAVGVQPRQEGHRSVDAELLAYLVWRTDLPHLIVGHGEVRPDGDVLLVEAAVPRHKHVPRVRAAEHEEHDHRLVGLRSLMTGLRLHRPRTLPGHRVA